ncbi:hypothetical protein [Rhodanobacter sp. L36]|uniref:hypothetical protein n=1 Tax=Rhodanobacter sp. L36 TaxID=1747221 RepID=UPI00131DA92A|nr:hypothetical protein [Rhodanobacter sp. L36]
MNHGDPKNPKKNPHPVKRYEVTATAEAPGPWDSVKGIVFFEVLNAACTPEDKFLGVHAIPRDVPVDFKMIRIDEKTWKGYFYRDSMRDEDYYGLGICHWEASGVSAIFTAHGVTFASGDALDVFLRKGSQTSFFRKSFYEDRSSSLTSVPDFSAINPQVVQHPNDFFPISVNVKEAMP